LRGQKSDQQKIKNGESIITGLGLPVFMAYTEHALSLCRDTVAAIVSSLSKFAYLPLFSAYAEARFVAVAAQAVADDLLVAATHAGREDGLSVRDTASMLGVGKSTVERALRTEMKGQEGWPKVRPDYYARQFRQALSDGLVDLPTRDGIAAGFNSAVVLAQAGVSDGFDVL